MKINTSANNKKYRHEYKYLISKNQLLFLKNNVDSVLSLDRHIDEKGFYTIRSVYYDDMDNTCFYENENGTDPREKFRIRMYNQDESFISLELKQKQNGKCRKSSCRITKEQCEILINGGVLSPNKDYPPILQKFLLQIQTRNLHPSVIVEYDRIPYVHILGNVRVTFDQNIRSSNQCTDFFKKDIALRPILPADMHILEVKWDEFLPSYINTSLMLDSLQWTSFSKFYLCRKYTPNGFGNV